MKPASENTLIAVSIGLVAGGILLGALLNYAGVSSEKPVPPPSDVICAIFDMSTPDGRRWKGWHPVSAEKRDDVRTLALAGKVEWIPANSIDCIERDPRNPRFGEVVEQRRMEWWRWVEKKPVRQRSTHD